MAENDTRVDSLEDEVKVLKGEVRRTLVDLRALLMREDSPLNEGSLGRRSTPVEWDPNEGSPQTRMDVTETVRQGPGNGAGPAGPDKPAPEPAAARPNPPQPAYPDQGLGMVPPQMGPQQWAGWPGPQAAQAPPPPQVSPGLESAMAERERRMAEQEQRMAEQERRIADQEQKLASSERSQSSRDREPPDEGRMAEQEQRMAEQERRIADQERKLAISERAQSGRDRDPPDEEKRQEIPAQPNQPASSGPERERPSAEVDVEVGSMEQQEPSKPPTGRVQTTEPEDGQGRGAVPSGTDLRCGPQARNRG